MCNFSAGGARSSLTISRHPLKVLLGASLPDSWQGAIGCFQRSRKLRQTGHRCLCLLWGRGSNPKLPHSVADGDAFDVGIGISTGQNIANICKTISCQPFNFGVGWENFDRMARQPPKSLQFLCKHWNSCGRRNPPRTTITCFST